MKDFTTGKIGKSLLPFLIPMLFNNFITQLYYFFDTAIIGHFLGKEALSAVGGIFPVLFIIYTVVIGFQVGATAVTAKYFSLNKYEKIEKVVYSIFSIMLFFGLFVSVIGLVFTENIVRLMSIPEQLIPMSKSYFRALIIGSVFTFNLYAFENILQGLGNSKVPLYFSIAFSIINIIGDWLFIVVFRMGVAGAGLSTSIANFLVFGGISFYFRKKIKIFDFRLKIKPDFPILKEIAKIGLPTVGQMLGISSSIFVGQNLINKFGVDIIAATTVGNRISSTVKIMGVAVSAAMTTFVSQNYAKKLYKRIKAGVKYGIGIMIFFSVLMTFIAIFFPQEVISLFTNDPSVIALSTELLGIVAPFYVFGGFSFVLTGTLRGTGKTLYTMIFSIISLWGIKIIMILILAYDVSFNPLVLIPVNYKGLWLAYVASNTTEALLYITFFLSGKWK